MLQCFTPFVQCPSQLLFCTSQLMFCISQLMFCPSPMMFCHSQMMFCPTPMMFCPTPMMFCPTPLTFCPGNFHFEVKHGGIYTESEQVCEFYITVPLGITHSKQLPPLAGPAKNEYKLYKAVYERTGRAFRAESPVKQSELKAF